ncbi:MAG: hypothetical protein GX643_01735 [Acidimicrobiales bacterium]|nr:hypothetical protein [Acidimicrobiales bacterium]
MNENEGSGTSTFHAIKGSIKRKLGWLTADRDVEAEGAAEEDLEAPPTEHEVQEAKHEIKADYGEVRGTPNRGPDDT